MNEITTTAAIRSIDNSLFAEFVKWIDRSEKTTRTYLMNLKQFMLFMQREGITQPTRDDIIFYRQYLSETRKPNTVAQYLRSVGQFFRWTAANNIYPDIAANIHAPKVKHDTHKKDALTAQEVLTIENSIKARAIEKAEAAATQYKDQAGRMQRSTEQGKRLYAMYLLAVNAGLRTIELHRANVKDLETKGGNTVLYVFGKGHAEADQKKPIAPEVAAAIKDYLNSRTDNPNGNSPLFVSTGNRSRGKRIATTTISTMLKRAMQEAGFDSERLTAHSLRHTAGTAVQSITGDLYATQKYMRHSNPATTEIYLHNDTEKADANIAQQLYNLYHGEQVITTLNPQQIASLLKQLNITPQGLIL